MQKIWKSLNTGSGAILAFVAILGAIGGFLEWYLKPNSNNETTNTTQMTQSNVVNYNESNNISLPLEIYKEHIANAITARTAELEKAHSNEKQQLQKEIDELQARLANPEQALQEANKIIAQLQSALETESNKVGIEKINKAKAALKQGDFSIADALFAEIETLAQSAVERAADAAFARGQIAEQQVRWNDAAMHYAKAARLQAHYKHLSAAQNFAMKTGDYNEAIKLSDTLVPAAIDEYDANSREHGNALNSYASALFYNGNYQAAEPLYQQALEIRKQALGETHPDYATNLNNLAELYKTQGLYAQAEPLYLQALEIHKQALGETHPSYATSLNNLAGLYKTQGLYAQAEPLYLQALAITKQALGEAHPSYATSLNNLAGLYESQGLYEQAEPLYQQAIKIMEATLGRDHPNTQTVKQNYARLRKHRS